MPSEKIEIKVTGSYLPVDENGYIINPASAKKFQDEWKPIIQDMVGIYIKLYGDSLKQVCLRGSVAKGEAVRDVSDVDSFAYVDLTSESTKLSSISKKLKTALLEKYPFVEDIEITAFPASDSANHQIILNQSVCIYGEPIAVPKIKPGKDLAIHAPSFHNRFMRFEKFLDKQQKNEQEIKKDCVWFMKGLLRAGFELTMERSFKYTRDLYRCYETFAEFYPEKEFAMREALDLALNPTTDKQKIKQVMDKLGQWLLAEIPKHFEVKDTPTHITKTLY